MCGFKCANIFFDRFFVLYYLCGVKRKGKFVIVCMLVEPIGFSATDGGVLLAAEESHYDREGFAIDWRRKFSTSAKVGILICIVAFKSIDEGNAQLKVGGGGGFFCRVGSVDLALNK